MNKLSIFVTALALSAVVSGQGTSLKVVAFQAPDDLPRDGECATWYRPCSFYCGVTATIKVSSQLPSSGKISYRAQNLMDFDPATAWASRGVGEWAEFQFTHSGTGKPKHVTEVGICSGYQKSQQAWKDNARPKLVELQLNGRKLGQATLPDTRVMQKIQLAGKGAAIKPGDRLRVTVLDSYPGARYQDLCITELHYSGTGVSH